MLGGTLVAIRSGDALGALRRGASSLAWGQSGAGVRDRQLLMDENEGGSRVSVLSNPGQLCCQPVLIAMRPDT